MFLNVTLSGDKFFIYKMKKSDLNIVFKLFFEELFRKKKKEKQVETLVLLQTL